MKNDLKLVERFKCGDESAFDELIFNHKDWVFNFINNVIKNKEDAKDLAQDVFVKVYFNVRKFKCNSKFNTWLYRIVINQMNNYFKKRKLLSWFQYDYNDHIHFTDEESGRSAKRNKLMEGVKRLSKIQRSVVLLRIYQDMTFKEVSNILSITENSAKASFFKAKRNLKGLINE